MIFDLGIHGSLDIYGQVIALTATSVGEYYGLMARWCPSKNFKGDSKNEGK